MTQREMTRKAQSIMKEHFGFAPAQKQIILLEATGDGSTILWKVGSKEYDYKEAHYSPLAKTWIDTRLEIRDAFC